MCEFLYDLCNTVDKTLLLEYVWSLFSIDLFVLMEVFAVHLRCGPLLYNTFGTSLMWSLFGLKQ